MTQNYPACLCKESGRNPHSEILLQANLALIVNLSLNKDDLYTLVHVTLAHYHMDNENFHNDASSTTTDSEHSIPSSLLDWDYSSDKESFNNKVSMGIIPQLT